MKTHWLLLVLLFLVGSDLIAQKKNKTNSDPREMKSAEEDPATFAGLKLRNIGPAFTSGRIADIAIHPNDDNVWYVAVGSGGVWKTTNAGNTWTPIFDSQKVFSTGCITIDPNNPSIIWLGSGENVGGRHAGFGDGIYKSMDDGNTWKNVGLDKSEHISKIVVHPENSNIVWVAAQGPLWSKGGERGLYKTNDGGTTWNRTLGDAEWMGATDIAMDPRNPDVLYVASWQRHRTVAAYMGGGPLSGIHKSTDGGETWEKLSTGLPKGNMGKIGLAMSPQQPDIIYAAIELDRTKGGLYKSTNRGASWTKQSDAVSGATGPHYYQELYASPHAFDRLYLMDVRIQVSDDGGKTFRILSEEEKHSDNHALAFRTDDPDYLLVGTDAGIYESFDLAENWSFFDNLPLVQYYKVAVNDAKPFYHVFGGTQDNGSHGGPSRTDNQHGIRNGDWYKTLGADGHQTVTEPGNPDIIYGEFQQGVTHRVDLKTGDQVLIQPQAREGEGYERFNWDAPILVSPHNPAQLFVASQRVWKSMDRGDSWEPISTDLTRNQERITLPIMGKQQSWDAPWDLKAMSNYNSITSLAESPLKAGLVYAGTDDGIIQVTENGGQQWRKIELNAINGVPNTAFVNDIKADLHNESTVYVSLDNHKYGDYKPYFIKSTDKGVTWKSYINNLPEKGMVWRMIQDHIDPNLLFLATEFGIYFSNTGGENWTKLKGGVPTISFRDLTIHRGESDLIGASFGRGFFILDDYSPLRNLNEASLDKEAILFPVKDALWYVPRNIASQQGAGEYVADNPEFGATFTYYLKDGYESLTDIRKKKEKELKKNNQNIVFPGWEAIDAEAQTEKPKLKFTVIDKDGNIIRTIESGIKKGINRITWDLKANSNRPILLSSGNSGGQGRRNSSGFMVSPGTYSVSISKIENGVVTQLTDSQTFHVKPLREGTLKAVATSEVDEFRNKLESLITKVGAFNHVLGQTESKVKAMNKALAVTHSEVPDLYKQLFDLKSSLQSLQKQINGSAAKSEIGERNAPSFQSRMFTGYRALSTTYGPTPNHRQTVDVAIKEFAQAKNALQSIVDKIPTLENELMKLGAPWIEGQSIPD
ncbi:MAG: photosystem II stability/assembly factor-like uncharacterized protein [Saprospiraceae bacterium]|jgi:photosystem II stability/assembly factor-like uncharacterized protein